MVQEQKPAAKKRKVDAPRTVDEVNGGSYPNDFLEQLEAENGHLGDSIETEDAWPRPDLPTVNPATDTIIFQQIDVAESSHPQYGPTLRLFGVTQNGNSILAHVHGFRPYFYVAAPSGFMQTDLAPLKDTLNSALQSGSIAVADCEIANRKSLWGYKGDDTVPFIKIVCTEPKALPKVKDEFFEWLSQFIN